MPIRIASIIAPDPKRLQQRFEQQKHVVFAATKDVGQDLAGVVIDGMPEPAWVALVLTFRTLFRTAEAIFAEPF